MMNKIKIIGLIWVFTVVTVQAQTPLPAKKQTEKIAIINGTLHIGNGEVIEEPRQIRGSRCKKS
jgi:hypothetical protein